MFGNIKKSLVITFSLILFIGIAGFLISIEDAHASACTDSDEGKNYYLAGEVNDGENTFEDKCTYDGTGLEEFYCGHNNSWGHVVVRCSGGCKDGKCFGEAMPPSCTDEDGGENIYESSIAHTEYGGGQYDCCLQTTSSSCSDEGQYLKEALCKDNPAVGEYVYTHKIIKCSYGCKDNRCLKEKQDLYILSPNGGEEWEGGKTYEIKWKNPTNDIKKININLYKRLNYDRLIARNIAYGVSASVGSYKWTVPSNLKSRYYLIKISNADTNADPDSYNYTNDVFYIKQSVKSCTDSDGGKNHYIKGSTEIIAVQQKVPPQN